MRYTPAQVRDLVVISEETLRHWRKVLPPIKDKRGYAPCFTYGEVLALKIIILLVSEFGMGVRTFSKSADKFFDSVTNAARFPEQVEYLIFEPESDSIRITRKGELEYHLQTIGLVVPIEPIIFELRQKLLTGSDHDLQSELKLTPGLVASKSS